MPPLSILYFMMTVTPSRGVRDPAKPSACRMIILYALAPRMSIERPGVSRGERAKIYKIAFEIFTFRVL